VRRIFPTAVVCDFALWGTSDSHIRDMVSKITRKYLCVRSPCDGPIAVQEGLENV
jgi:hypothetical protein